MTAYLQTNLKIVIILNLIMQIYFLCQNKPEFLYDKLRRQHIVNSFSFGWNS